MNGLYRLDSIAFVEELVAIKSLSGEEMAVANYLVTTMQQLGFEAKVDEAGNAVGAREKLNADGEIDREIVMLGHMDTVPGDIPVRIEDGILHGRGSVDAKGPLATFVMAAAQADIPAGTRLVVIGAVEEEAATSKGARHVIDKYQPDWCIIGEPSGWDGVTLGYKGRILIDYTYRQSMSHTAGQDGGAAEVGIAWYNQVDQYVQSFNAEHDKVFDQLLPSVREIRTDSDGITNSIYIKLGIRLPLDFDIAEFEETVRSWAGEAEVDFYGHEAAFRNGRTTTLARTFNKVMRQQDIRPKFKVKTGTSDMNVVAPVWQCPIVAFGPGDSSLDHTPEEHLVLDEYLRAIEILKSVLEIRD